MVITRNLQASNTSLQYNAAANSRENAALKLGSGFRINKSADDAAGLAISEKMRSQVAGFGKASQNSQAGISLIQTAEGVLGEVHSLLQRMNELATQAANDTNTSVDRQTIQDEIDNLTEQIDKISETTQFNNMNLLDGTFTCKNLQVGALSGQNIEISINSMSAASLGLTLDEDDESPPGDSESIKPLPVKSFLQAGDALSKIQNAILQVSDQRAYLGAIQNRIEHTVLNIDCTSENTAASESRIRDANMASEILKHSKDSTLMNAGEKLLAQANQSPQGTLLLLQ